MRIEGYEYMSVTLHFISYMDINRYYRAKFLLGLFILFGVSQSTVRYSQSCTSEPYPKIFTSPEGYDIEIFIIELAQDSSKYAAGGKINAPNLFVLPLGTTRFNQPILAQYETASDTRQWLLIFKKQTTVEHEFIAGLKYTPNGQSLLVITHVTGGPEWRRRLITIDSVSGTVSTSVQIKEPTGLGCYFDAQHSMVFSDTLQATIYLYDDPQSVNQGNLLETFNNQYFMNVILQPTLTTIGWVTQFSGSVEQYNFASIIPGDPQVQNIAFVSFISQQNSYVAQLDQRTGAFDWVVSHPTEQNPTSIHLAFDVISKVLVKVDSVNLSLGNKRVIRIVVISDFLFIQPPQIFQYENPLALELIGTYVVSLSDVALAMRNVGTDEIVMMKIRLGLTSTTATVITQQFALSSDIFQWARFASEDVFYLPFQTKKKVESPLDDGLGYSSLIFSSQKLKDALSSSYDDLSSNQGVIYYSTLSAVKELDVNNFFTIIPATAFQIVDCPATIKAIDASIISPQTKYISNPIVSIKGAPDTIIAVAFNIATQRVYFKSFILEIRTGHQCQTMPTASYSIDTPPPFIGIDGNSLLVSHTSTGGKFDLTVQGAIFGLKDTAVITLQVRGTAPYFKTDPTLWTVEENMAESYLYKLPEVVTDEFASGGYTLTLTSVPSQVTIEYLVDTKELFLSKGQIDFSSLTGNPLSIGLVLMDRDYPNELRSPQKFISLLIKTNDEVNCDMDPFPKWLLCKDQSQTLTATAIDVPQQQQRFAFAVAGLMSEACAGVSSSALESPFIAFYDKERAEIQFIQYFQGLGRDIRQISFSPDESLLAAFALALTGNSYLITLSIGSSVQFLKATELLNAPLTIQLTAKNANPFTVLQIRNEGYVYFAGSDALASQQLTIYYKVYMGAANIPGSWVYKSGTSYQTVKNLRLQVLSGGFSVIHLFLYNYQGEIVALAKLIDFDTTLVGIAVQAATTRSGQQFLRSGAPCALAYELKSATTTWAVAAVQTFEAASRFESFLFATLYDDSVTTYSPAAILKKRQVLFYTLAYPSGRIIDGIIDSKLNYCQLVVNYGATSAEHFVIFMFPIDVDDFRVRVFQVSLTSYQTPAYAQTFIYGRLRKSDLHFYILENRDRAYMTEMTLLPALTATKIATVYSSDKQVSCISLTYDFQTMDTYDANHVLDHDYTIDGSSTYLLATFDFSFLQKLDSSQYLINAILPSCVTLESTLVLAERGEYVANCKVPQIQLDPPLSTIDKEVEWVQANSGQGYLVKVPDFTLKWKDTSINCQFPITNYQIVDQVAKEATSLSSSSSLSTTRSPSLFSFDSNSRLLVIKDIETSIILTIQVKIQRGTTLAFVNTPFIKLTFSNGQTAAKFLPPLFRAPLRSWGIFQESVSQSYLVPPSFQTSEPSQAPLFSYFSSSSLMTVTSTDQKFLTATPPATITSSTLQGIDLTIRLEDNWINKPWEVLPYSEYEVPLSLAESIDVRRDWLQPCFSEITPIIYQCQSGYFSYEAIYATFKSIAVGGSTALSCVTTPAAEDYLVPIFILYDPWSMSPSFDLTYLEMGKDMTVREIHADIEEKYIAMLVESYGTNPAAYADSYVVVVAMANLVFAGKLKNTRQLQSPKRGRRVLLDNNQHLYAFFDTLYSEENCMAFLWVDLQQPDLSKLYRSGFIGTANILDLSSQPQGLNNGFYIGYNEGGVDHYLKFTDQTLSFPVEFYMKASLGTQTTTNHMITSFQTRSIFAWQAIEVSSNEQSIFVVKVDYSNTVATSSQPYRLELSSFPIIDGQFELLSLDVTEQTWRPRFVFSEADSSGKVTNLYLASMIYVPDFYQIELKKMHFPAPGYQFHVSFIKGDETDSVQAIFRLSYTQVNHAAGSARFSHESSGLMNISTSETSYPFDLLDSGLSFNPATFWKTSSSILIAFDTTIPSIQGYFIDFSADPEYYEPLDLSLINMEYADTSNPSSDWCGGSCSGERQFEVTQQSLLVLSSQADKNQRLDILKATEFELPACNPENIFATLVQFQSVVPPCLIVQGRVLDFSGCTQRFESTITFRLFRDKISKYPTYNVVNVINRGPPTFSDEKFKKEYKLNVGTGGSFILDLSSNPIQDPDIEDQGLWTVSLNSDCSGIFAMPTVSLINIEIPKTYPAGEYACTIILNDRYQYKPGIKEYELRVVVSPITLDYIPPAFRPIYEMQQRGESLEGVPNPLLTQTAKQPIVRNVTIPVYNRFGEDRFWTLLKQMQQMEDTGAVIPQFDEVLSYLGVGQTRNLTSGLINKHQAAQIIGFNRSLFLVKDPKNGYKLAKLLQRGRPSQLVTLRMLKPKQVSSDGLVTLRFSERSPYLMQMVRDSGQLSIFIEYYDESLGNGQASEISYKIMEMGGDFLTIKIYLGDRSSVSLSQVKDMVKFEITMDLVYLTEKQTITLPKGTQQRASIPAQIDESTKMIVELAMQSTTIASIVLISGNALLNIFISGAMSYLYGLLNCLSSLTILTLIPISIPGPARLISKTIVSISQFDLLPAQDILEKLRYNSLSDISANDELEDLGFSTSSASKSMGSAVIYLAILIQIMLATPFLFGALKMRFPSQAKRIFDAAYWNLPIRFMLSQYLTLYLAALIQGDYETMYYGDYLDIYLSKAFLIVGSIFPSTCILMGLIIQNVGKLKEKCSPLIEDAKESQRLQRICSSLEVLRLQITLVVLLYLRDHPSIQIMALYFQSLLSQAYIVYFKPQKNQNIIQFFNEFLTTIYLLTLATLTDHQQVSTLKVHSGWALIGNYGVCFAINFFMITKEVVKGLRELRERCRKSRGTQRVRKYQESYTHIPVMQTAKPFSPAQSVTRFEHSEQLDDFHDTNTVVKVEQTVKKSMFYKRKPIDKKTITAKDI